MHPWNKGIRNPFLRRKSMFEGLMFRITNLAMLLFASDDPGGLMGRPGVDTGAVPPPPGTDPVTGGYATQPPPEGGGMGTIMIVYVVVLLVAMYFLLFRGPRRREKKMREMQSSIRTGDNVVVTGGMFGRIADVGEDCFIVEFGTNRGIRIPVLKSDVLGVREPKMTPPPKVIDAPKDSEKSEGK